MSAPTVFIELIEKILRRQQIHFPVISNTIKVDHEKWTEYLLWISKFVFDNEWNYFKANDVYNLLGHIDNRTKLQRFADDFDISSFLTKYVCLPSIFELNITCKTLFLEEIIQNFNIDKKELTAIFKLTSKAVIVKIELGKGDMHNQGKTTAIIHLNTNKKLVYKPRAGKLDAAFNELTRIINSHNLGIDLKSPKVLDKGNYSWFEYIEHRTTESELQIKNYYKRCGALLGIIYFLNGFDFHFENMIAHGEYPVLIDLECMFYTNTEEYDVLHSGFLPQVDNTKNGIGDISGLSADGFGETSMYWKWKDLDSDKLDLIKSKGVLRKEKNQPLLHNIHVSPEAYVHHIIKGFQSISKWFFLQKKNDTIKNALSNFKNISVRVLPRPTQSYVNILENSYLPKALACKDERSKTIDKYLQDFPFLTHIHEKHKNEIRKSEKKALLRMDVPYFTANTSQKYIEESGKKIIDNYFNQTPFEAIVERINGLKADDIKEQILLMQKAFKARYKLEELV